MEWSNESVFLLIEQYRQKELLWNAKHRYYYHKIKKNDAWEEIATEFRTTVEEIKKKINTLLSSLRREKMKIKKSLVTGAGADEVFHSSWPYFNCMTFLLDKDKPRETLNTITTEKEISNVEDPTEVDKIIVDRANEEAVMTVHNVAKPPTNKKMKVNEERLEKAFSILEASAAGKKEDNEFQIFGNYIGKKLEKYSLVTRNAVQQGIMAIICNADMGFYETPFPSIQPPGYSLHPHYPQPQNSLPLHQNNIQQSEHLQPSVSYSFSSDTNTTSSTCNQSLSPASVNPSPSPGNINVNSPTSSFQNSPVPTTSEETFLFQNL